MAGGDDTSGKGVDKDAVAKAAAASASAPGATNKAAPKKAVPMYGDGNRETKSEKPEKPEKPAKLEIAQPPPWWKRLRHDPPFPIRIALGASLVALIFLLWWFITRSSECTHGPIPAGMAANYDPCGHTRMVSPTRLPSPGEVWRSLGTLGERHIVDNIFATLQRVFLGVGLAALVGVGLGILAGSIRSVAAALGPVVIFLRSVPMTAMLFLTLLMFGGVGETQKTLYIFLAVVPFVFSDAIKAVAIVPERYVETAQTLGASRFQIIWKVLVPLAVPDIITSLRFQFGLALGYITLAEATGQELGLGAMIEVSNRIGPREHVIALLFIIAFIAYGVDLLLRTIQRGAFRWRKDL
ncbi:MAG: ABC transporter permease [Proteobacteria bacterium]|nr:ABC transporter permease [Pseudomonadota bacterium]